MISPYFMSLFMRNKLPVTVAASSTIGKGYIQYRASTFAQIESGTGILDTVNSSFVYAATDADSPQYVTRGFLTFDVSQFTNATSAYLKLDGNYEPNYRLIFIEANQADTLNTSTALSSFTSINRAIKYTDLFWYNAAMMLPLTADAIAKINQNSLLRVAIITEQDYNLNLTLNTNTTAFLQNPKLIIS